ncbi:hypothetical protein NOR53_18 [gamma proteobacterium NOR5-3]|nr:hypothetical protein NOR53_18 [gamma proteobacterium NOR5-3]
MRHAWLSGLFIVVVALAAMQATAEEQSLAISNGEYSIPGILSLPSDSPKPAAAVLLLHGTASQKNEVGNLYQRFAKTLSAAGIASLRIDFAGAGDSPVDHSVYSLSGANRDAQASFDTLALHPLINPQKIIVLGFSQGGLIAQRLALQEPRLLGLSTWSSVATDGAGSFGDFFERYHGQAQSSGYAQVSFDWLPEPLAFSLQWFQEIQAQQTLSEMRGFKGPIFAVAGTADTTVPFEQSVALVGQSQHPLSQLVLLAGADHIFNVLAPPDPRSKAESHDRLLSVTLEWMLTLIR